MNNIQTIFRELSPPAQDLFRHIQKSEFKLIQLINNQAIILGTNQELPRMRAETLIKELSPTFLTQTEEEQWQIPETLRETEL